MKKKAFSLIFPFLSPASLEPQGSQRGKQQFFQNLDPKFVFSSAFSAPLRETKDFFLSPASLETAESAEKEKPFLLIYRILGFISAAPAGSAREKGRRF